MDALRLLELVWRGCLAAALSVATAFPLGVRRLKTLALENNNISRLPKTCGQLSSLSQLTLQGNPIQYPPAVVITRVSGPHLLLLALRQGHNRDVNS